MSVPLIVNRRELIANARAYEDLVTNQVYRLPTALKKTALETVTRTQAWIGVRDANTSGDDVWLPVPQKWGGVRDVDVKVYEANRRGGIDVQAIGQIINRMGCYEAPRSHKAWTSLRSYASDLGLDLRTGAALWVIEGEDLPYVERLTLEIVADLAETRRLSEDARKVLARRLTA